MNKISTKYHKFENSEKIKIEKLAPKISNVSPSCSSVGKGHECVCD